MLKCKIHRATVTEADLHYVGSITIDEDLTFNNGGNEDEKLVCKAWGSGCPYISKMVATCAYKYGTNDDVTEVYYGEFLAVM